MKKLFKKIAAVVMTAVIAVSAMVIPTTTASAAGVFDGAVNISELEYYSKQFTEANQYQYYKIVLPSSGDITLRAAEEYNYCRWRFYDSNATEIQTDYFGRDKTRTIENLKAGTYYLYVIGERDTSYVKDFYYTFTPDNKATISLKLTIEKGDVLQFGALTSNYTGKTVTWVSTKKSVATVTSKGKVTAKKAGSTVIRAQLEDGTYVQIKIVVKNPTTTNT